MDPTIIGAIIVAALAPLGTYLIARRRMSGSVESSEAVELWKESSAMRKDYRILLERADARITALEGRISILEELNAELRLRLEAS